MRRLAFGAFVAAAIAFTIVVAPVSFAGAEPSGTGAGSTTWTRGPRLGGLHASINGDALAQTKTSTGDVLHGVVMRLGAVRYRRSADDTWVGARVSPTTHDPAGAVIETARSRVYVAWRSLTDHDLRGRSPLYVRSAGNHGTGTWGPVRSITPLDVRADGPSLAAAGRRLYVAYTDTRSGAIRLAMSRDRGVTWSTTRLGTTTRRSFPGVSGEPVVVARGSTVAVAWLRDGAGTVRFRRSMDRGATWSKPRTLGTGAGQGAQPGLAIRRDRIAVAWVDGDAVRVRIRDGSGWGTLRTVDPPMGTKVYAKILDVDVDLHGTAAVGVAFSACWQDCTGDWPGYADVIWSETASNGGTWTAPDVVLAGGPHPSGDGPVVVIRADVLWAPDGTRYLVANKVLDFDRVHVPLRIGVG